MRPPRLILLLLCFVALPIFLTFFSLIRSHPRHQVTTESSSATQKGGIRALFSFSTPSSIFGPSAIISLTDDNSTFFLARPAAFGPLLSSNGLSGQLWVGSGFGDDNLRRGGATTGAEGELGCSDVPGWGDGDKPHHGDTSTDALRKKIVAEVNDGADKTHDQASKEKISNNPGRDTKEEINSDKTTPFQDDGTDDHLHHPLQGSQVSKPPKAGRPAQQHDTTKDGHLPEHGDIQSIQEGAEITGKIVLLSRGGCGFLEKAMWTQRRGGVALIVGDDTRGGVLITMYGRGDTSNVTIPSLFTSHTTAHLLSSLIPSDGFFDENLGDDPQKTIQTNNVAGKNVNKKKTGVKKKSGDDRPTFTPATAVPKTTSTPRPSIVPAQGKHLSSADSNRVSAGNGGQSWFRSFASAFGFDGRSHISGLPEDSRRPPSSGRINWIVSENWADEPNKEKHADTMAAKGGHDTVTTTGTRKSGVQQSSSDDFVIGVQDWRDPDLVQPKSMQAKSKGKSNIAKTKPTSYTAGVVEKVTEHKESKALAGGSITPGSGEYEKPSTSNEPSKKAFQDQPHGGIKGADRNHQNDESNNWLTQFLWNDDAEAANEPVNHRDKSDVTDNHNHKLAEHQVEELSIEEDNDNVSDTEGHYGLWVTLTPTTMSTSPFFDTLLVLVVSPLVTLTVVYALLLLRSRIRRRRWRAPKSVVDRLPVRTYYTMSCSSSSTSSQFASPKTSSPTSPLLQSSPRSTSSRPRPRSRTTSGIGNAISASLDQATMKANLLQQEKLAGSAVPRKPYSGKQVECVVCLEEYIDGQSRVMSLPCGHEFHAECM